MAPERTTPSSNKVQLTGFRSRRGSISSLASRGQIDKEALSQALDEVHATASRSEALTSFNDFEGGGSPRANSGPKELVTGGISGLYSRLKQSVGAASSSGEGSARPASRGSHGRAETASLKSTSSLALKLPPEDASRRPTSDNNGASTTSSTISKGAEAVPINVAEKRHEHLQDIPERSPVVSAVFSDKESASTASLTHVEETRSRKLDLGKDIQLTLPETRNEERSVRDARPFLDRSQGNVGAGRTSGVVKSQTEERVSDDESIMPTNKASTGLTVVTPSQPSAGVQESGIASDPSSRRQSQNAQSKLATFEAGIQNNNQAVQAPSLKMPTERDHLPMKHQQLQVSQSHLPSFRVSRASSSDVLSLGSPALTPGPRLTLEPSPNFNTGLQGHRLQQKRHAKSDNKEPAVPVHLKRRVISKEFWMKDENARDCFYCGDAFSTFRRKHHCRTCGQIFDAKCTMLVPGKPFGQPGTLRLCKPCEAMIYGSDDDSTVFTDDEDGFGASPANNVTRPPPLPLGASGGDETALFKPEQPTLATPSIGIPVSRRNREAKRRSAVIEFDAPPVLARPSSSRSLKSLSGRPRSSSHKRYNSRHHPIRSLRHADERGPFYQDVMEGERRLPALPAFHNDNIIDPELAAFLSDEGSEDDQPSIMAALNGDIQGTSADGERAGLAGFLASAVKKGRSRLGDRSVGAQSMTNLRDADGISLSGKYTPKLRRRNPSIGSVMNVRPSPRRSRSNNLLKNLDDGGFADPRSTSPLAFEENLMTSTSDLQIKRSATMHGSAAPAVELNRASLEHVKRLLVQCLEDAKVRNRSHWEKALLPILLQCTDDVDPDVQRGDDMDIRNYIKLKKIPGGRPGDTAYVSGVVFSKNVALKSMKRSFIQPRIIIVTFALEYARYHQHFMSLEPVIAQEREYLRSLVARIAALKPHVLLVERNVSGLALQMLDEAGITVVYNIKDSVLAAVGRMTQTVLIKSVDKLGIDSDSLGRCGSFDVKTYVHGNIRKSYIYISGCQPDLGCTIVLRGAEVDTLRQVKRIAEFMCYVVYNLKLETCLMRDEFVLIPSHPNVGIVAGGRDVKKSGREARPIDNASAAEAAYQNAQFTATPTESGSSTSPPAVQELDRETVKALITAANHTVSDDEQAEDGSIPSEYRGLVEKARTRIISSSPFAQYTEPHLLTQAYESERKVEYFKRLRDQYAAMETAEAEDEKNDPEEEFELVQPEMIKQAVPGQQSKTVRDFLHAVHDDQYEKALQTYDVQKRQWKQFFAGSNENPFDPFSHQNIVVLHSIVSSITSAPCAGPDLLQLGFYAGYNHAEPGFEEDCTLGQYVEDICMGAQTSCKTCNRKMFDHHRSYVHGNGQLSVSVKRHPSKIHGLHSTILMWSACKICNLETTVIPMSDNTWKYSLGKYLELSFWSTPLKPRAGLCPHDIHKDFVRCFGFQDMVVRVQYDSIDIYDVIVPGTVITWEVHADLTLKNQQYSAFRSRLAAFTASIKARLSSINLSSVAPEIATDATAAVEKLTHQADRDHQEMLKKLQDKYTSSRFYELIPFNRAVRLMDEKALEWDEAFADFERNFFPSENDIRRLAALQLKKLFLDRSEAAEAPANEASDTEEGMEMQDRASTKELPLTDEAIKSEKAQDMLNSVLEEEHEQSAPKADMPQAHPFRSEKAEDDTLGASLSRKLTPTECQEQAVEREDVKHLDLAVPSMTREASAGSEQSDPNEDSAAIVNADTSSGRTAPESFAGEPKPLTSTILERLEQMRSSSAAGSAGSETLQPESRIPRLADLRKRSGGSSVAPPLIRAHSQPNHVPRRSTDMSLDMPSIDAVTSGEHSRDEQEGSSYAPSKELANRVEQRLTDRLGGGHFKTMKSTSLIPRSIPTKTDYNNTRVSALAKHFEQLSREFERERLRERRLRAARSRQNRANPLASSRPVVEVYKDAREAVGEKNDDLRVSVDEPSSELARVSDGTTAEPSQETSPDQPRTSDEQDNTDQYTDTEMGGSTVEHTASDTEADGEATDTELTLSETNKQEISDPTSGMSSTLLSPTSPHEIETHLDLSLPKHEKSTLMKMLTSFWSERSASGWLPLEYPLLATEHVFDDSDIIVREDEPSSVIALALSSADYLTKQAGFREKRRGRTHAHQHTSSTVSTMSLSDPSVQEAIEASLLGDVGTHMRYSFTHGQVKAQCKIFYAESFDALRRKCGISERFVESLSRCAKWDSKGGKTKSLFLKTLDDRFVIKSLQEVELKAFTKFAPDYFAFMSHTLFRGVPSVIAKMFGLFQVVIKNPATGVEFSYYLLVMENLFYDRKPTRRFDLKGSMRNRKIESTGQPDEVLLDENLVETIFETPLFVREHNRKLLKASVWNDTLWLCKQNVMDYSLMAGFDDERKQLVVGIIDCIRTYTWDKKLESWIKDRGKNKPTITSPKDYRNRFRVSMMQYVLQAPNVWHQFSSQMAPPRTLRGLTEQERDGGERGAVGKWGVENLGEPGLGTEAMVSEMNAVLI